MKLEIISDTFFFLGSLNYIALNSINLLKLLGWKNNFILIKTNHPHICFFLNHPDCN